MWNKIKHLFSKDDYSWYEKTSRWLSPGWYSYLFKPWKGFRVFLCRIGGHSCGPVFYNPSGLEPDMHCKNCGEDLG